MESGDKFGKLTVVSFIKRGDGRRRRMMVECKCECGQEYYAERYNLTSGKVTSCGCSQHKGRPTVDISGQRFGNLVVTKQIGWSEPKKSGCRRSLWECNCDCGKTVNVTSNELRTGNTRSCGCILTAYLHRATPISVVNRMRFEAIKAGKVWTISDDEAYDLVTADCHYCGVAPQVGGSRNKHVKRNGIDRVDSQKGYVTGNVVPCCKRCNVAKNDQTYDEYLAQVKASYEHLFKNQA